LEEAAGIASGDDVGLEWGDKLSFAVAEGSGCIGLNEIVNAGGAAADGSFGNFEEVDAGNGCEKLARLRVDALRMIEVAGVVEGNAGTERMTFGARR